MALTEIPSPPPKDCRTKTVTNPAQRDPEAANNWTWLVIAAYTQAPTCPPPGHRPATPLGTPRPLEQAHPCPGPPRVRHQRAKIPTPARVPKPSRPGPGRPPGSKNRGPAERYDVGLLLVTGELHRRPTHHRTGTKPPALDERQAQGPDGPAIELRHAQHRLADKSAAKLDLAAAFVAGKITNMRTCLLRAARSGQLEPTEPTAARLLEARKNALLASSPAALTGIEGAASRNHFAAMGRVLGPTWPFVQRRRRPPPDPVNALLPFG